MSILITLVSLVAPDAQACAMPREAMVMVEAKPVAAPQATLADVFAEIDRVDTDNAAKDAIKKALESATNVGAATIPEATVPAAPPTARPST